MKRTQYFEQLFNTHFLKKDWLTLWDEYEKHLLPLVSEYIYFKCHRPVTAFLCKTHKCFSTTFVEPGEILLRLKQKFQNKKKSEWPEH